MVSVKDVVSCMLEFVQDVVVSSCAVWRQGFVGEDGRGIFVGTVDRFCVSKCWEQDNQQKCNDDEGMQ